MNLSLVKAMEILLADTYALYLKTHNYHWNVEGCCFMELHKLLEAQYEDLADAIDETAELIRGLGSKVPATFEIFKQNTNINDGDEKLSADDMISDLYDSNLIISKTLQAVLKEAQNVDDNVICGFVDGRMTVHRKQAWLLNSSQCKK